MIELSAISFLVLISCVVHGNIYTVVPDDDWYTSSLCYHCHSLQHYLTNATKYLNDNTQLQFLPGVHYLHTDLILQNTNNFMLNGTNYTNDGRSHTVIQCVNPSSLKMINSTKVTIQYITFANCTKSRSPNSYIFPYYYGVHTIQLYHCRSVIVQNITILSRSIYDSLLSINTIGDSAFNHFIGAGIKVEYQDIEIVSHFKNNMSHLYIDNYKFLCDLKCPPNSKIAFVMNQTTYSVHVELVNTNLCNDNIVYLVHISVSQCSQTIVKVIHCSCSGEINMPSNSVRRLFEVDEVCNSCSDKVGVNSVVHFKDCHFTHITSMVHELVAIKLTAKQCTQPDIHALIPITITGCIFNNTTNVIAIHSTWFDFPFDQHYSRNKIFITNTTFLAMSISTSFSMINLLNRIVVLEGPIKFYGIAADSLFEILHSVFYLHNHIEVSNCSLKFFTTNNGNIHMMLNYPMTLNFTNNDMRSFMDPHTIIGPHRPCLFQYFSNNTNGELLLKYKTVDYHIVFNGNSWVYPLGQYILLSHCIWLPGSAFNETLPSDVNQKFVTFVNEPSYVVERDLCYCTESGQEDCYIDQLGPIYPGQTLNAMFSYPGKLYEVLILDINDEELPETACKVALLHETKQIVGKNCTNLNFTITQTNDYYDWCELIFQHPITPGNAYYIKFFPCPAGFKKLHGSCECDPIMRSDINICDINDQTILRPANSWISAMTTNNTHSYLVSLNCPFDYCVPHSSRINLPMTSDLQCQFSRSNVLCGQCSHGLSTVFGSSNCKECSNFYLLIIIPVAIAGILLVLLLFFLNLTVVDGMINGFLLYVNIVSINCDIFFHPSHVSATAYVFISIANLDLGIETCFYNGMDDYAKMWLQLIFPIYLIFIATLLIITSRYCTRIQRLTAHRALPVLATLFLLSYTKILRTVSSVLFSYSTITSLPNKTTTLVWSVDANVARFGIKFIALFVVCLILFLILIPFNITLLFTRTLMRYRIVNYFKPLLDVYQAPYNINCYYWVGLHLLTKTLFYALSALDESSNLTISAVMLYAIGNYAGYLRPFKCWIHNCSELVLLFNLGTLYITALSAKVDTVANVMYALAAVHFSFIILYHMIEYTIGDSCKSKTQLHVGTLVIYISNAKPCLYISMLVKWISMRYNKTSPDDNIKCHGVFTSDIPDKTYDYSKYQELLLGVD